MNDIDERIAKLSPEKRALVEHYLREQDRAAARKHTIPRREASDQVPLSFAQQRLWLLDQFEPDSVVYNMPVALHLEGALDITALEKSLNEIVQRHEGLRTTFSSVDGEPMQIIVPKLSLELQITNLQEFPEAERDDECRNLAALEARRPFDISRGPLFRARLLRLEQDNHILLLTMHHIISDGWSRGVLYRELSTFYGSFCAKEPSSVPDLPIQYADFAAWQRQWLQGEILAEQLSYWREQLDGAHPVLELPTDRPRPPVQAYHGVRYRLHIPLPLAQSLKALSLQEKTTLFMLLLTGFKILLYRYTAEEDIIVGSPIANRNRSEIEGLIGFFANTLVLRTDHSDDPTVRELLARVREVCYGAYDHHDLPFEKLVEELQPERSLSHSPIFQVMFVLQNTPQSLPELSGLRVKQLEVDSGTTKFDLTLHLYDKKDGLLGEWEYDTDLFNAETIERMARHYQTILQGIVDDPEQHISDVPLLKKDERHQLLVEWNDTRKDYPRTKCFHELFEEQVNLNPAKISVEFQGDEISYNELDCRANQFAHYLRDIGVGPNALVGLFMDRSIDMMVSLLGILKAGGAYVPLDPDYPRERLAYMLAESRSSVLITQDKFKDDLPDSDAHVVLIDSDWERIAKMQSENRIFESGQGRPGPEDLAYVIFTSGSTGKPKGVKVPHRAVTNFLLSMSKEPGIAATDNLLAVTTLSFDIHVLELYTPLIVGGKVVIASRETAFDGELLAAALIDSNITVMQATPSTWRLMGAAGWEGSKQLKALCGGEVFPRDLVKQLIDRVGSLWNMYGPTETTVWSTCHQLRDAEGPIVVGRPIDNTQTYVVDTELQPVPVGVPGELYIGGDGVTHGYLNRPDLTSKAFVADPFSGIADTFIYKTGDLVKYHADGNIEYIDRLDNQIKLRGFRIELGEIEAVIGTYPAIKQAIAGVKEFGPDDQRLICHYKEQKGEAVDRNDLLRHLRSKLPEYMVPKHFRELEEFPLTPAGKIDRKALIARQWRTPKQGENDSAPKDGLEIQLVEIWEKVLHRSPIGRRDNFFEIGGHSLSATQVISRVKDTFRVNISMKSIFQGPTIADMALIIIQKMVEDADSENFDRLLNQIESLSDTEAQRIFGDKHS